MKGLLNRLVFKFIHQQWNIAIAERDNNLRLKNIHWIKHSYSDRWFADPFIISESRDSYIVLVEEFMRDSKKGRLAKLTISKGDFRILSNETVLDLPTHLSFPNPISVDGEMYIYPENGQSGKTLYYEYGETLHNPQELSSLPLADAVIFKKDNTYYLLYTIGKECNGNVLQVACADTPLGNYKHFQEIKFSDNIARRAGNVFEWEGRIISPAQVCNKEYGEGVSLQEIVFVGDDIQIKEITRLEPPTKDYPDGFHTYNVFKNQVVIDGYIYKYPFLRSIYYKLRRFI